MFRTPLPTTTTTTTTTTSGISTSIMTVNNTIMLGGEGGGAPSTSQIRDHIEQACIAIQVGDMQGALMELDLALGQLEERH